MNKKTIKRFAVLLIAIFAIIGIFFCAFFFPYNLGLYSGRALSFLDILKLIIYWSCSIACFFFLIFAIRIANNIGKELFYEKNTKFLFISGLILLIASTIFAISNLIFTIIDRNFGGIEFLYTFIGITGMAIASCVLLFAQYHSKAISIKKENDEII